jgi:hypothetical protein
MRNLRLRPSLHTRLCVGKNIFWCNGKALAVLITHGNHWRTYRIVNRFWSSTVRSRSDSILLGVSFVLCVGMLVNCLWLVVSWRDTHLPCTHLWACHIPLLMLNLRRHGISVYLYESHWHEAWDLYFQTYVGIALGMFYFTYVCSQVSARLEGE